MPRLRATRLTAIASEVRRLVKSVFAAAAAAFSVRIPAGSTYNGPLLRVRRASDNAEQDINALPVGDANGHRWLDTAALLAFVGAGNSGFVTTWYDQSGSGRNAVQATAANQPRIVNAGGPDLLNGRPALVFSANQWLLAPVSATNFMGALVGAVFGADSATTSRQMFDWRSVVNDTPLIDDGQFGGFGMRFRNNTNQLVGTAAFTFSAAPQVYSGVWSGSLLDVRLNGGASLAANVSGVITLDRLGIGTNGSTPGINNWLGRMSEMVVRTVLISGDARQALERSQGEAFGIAVA